MKQSEAQIHAQVCAYIRLVYPKVIFTSEASGLRLTIGQAKKMKALRSSSGLPDLWIMCPKKGFHGLFIELKAENPLKKDGMAKSDHIKDQINILLKLSLIGYACSMAVGFDQAIKVIDEYMKP